MTRVATKCFFASKSPTPPDTCRLTLVVLDRLPHLPVEDGEVITVLDADTLIDDSGRGCDRCFRRAVDSSGLMTEIDLTQRGGRT